MNRTPGHRAALLVFALLVSILFFGMIREFVVAVALAAIFAGVTFPLNRWITARIGGRSGVAALITIIAVLIGVIAPTIALLGLVAEQAVEISQAAVPWIEAQLEAHEAARPEEHAALLAKVSEYSKQVVTGSADLAQKVAREAAAGLGAVTMGAASFLFLLFVMLYAMYEFLKTGPALPRRIVRFMPFSDDEASRMLAMFTSVTRATLIGAFAIGAIQGTMAGVAFAVCGIQGALLWGVIMAVLSLIPGIGAPLVWIPAVLFLVVERRFGAAIGLAAWCGVAVGSVDNFLRPVLVGKGTNLPNLLVLLGTLGGVITFGPVGIILGPVVAAVFVTTWEMYGAVLDGASLPDPKKPVAEQAADPA